MDWVIIRISWSTFRTIWLEYRRKLRRHMSTDYKENSLDREKGSERFSSKYNLFFVNLEPERAYRWDTLTASGTNLASRWRSSFSLSLQIHDIPLLSAGVLTTLFWNNYIFTIHFADRNIILIAIWFNVFGVICE